MVFSSRGEERRLVMSTKMGIWRWALASAAILMAVGTASARVIDPIGATTNDPTAIVLYPQLKVDTNVCVAGFCTVSNTACATNLDCEPACNGGTCTIGGDSCTSASD